MLQQRIPSYALPPEFSKPEYMKLVPVPSIDSWLAGCFIFAVFFDVLALACLGSEWLLMKYAGRFQ